MGAAYAYAAGELPMPPDVELANAVDRFGGMAVFGRTIGALEMRRISLSENIGNAYQAREKADDWAEWSAGNQGAADLLGLALRAALDLGLIDE